MIITRTPYRVSFFGGGTDFPAHYSEHGGAVISSTINRYSYIHCRHLPPYFDHKYRIRYFQTERVSSVADIQHPSVRECIRFLDYKYPLEILHSGDIPAMSGIGSSSSFTVGLLMALYGLQGRMVTKRELAEHAIHVEQERIVENVGSQDQYAAAFGGLNRIDFGKGKRISVSPIFISPNDLSYLQDNLLFYFSGIARMSSEIQAEHKKNLPLIVSQLNEMHQMVDEAQHFLGQGKKGIDAFGSLLHEAWKLKKSFSKKVSTGVLDVIYKRAMDAGASGGKVCGAGGGGFMMFYVRPEYREKVKEALKGMLLIPIRLEYLGAHVVFYTHEDSTVYSESDASWSSECL